MKNKMTDSQQRDLFRKFQGVVEERSTQFDGSKSYGYQAGYYIGFLMGLTHIPEVQKALQLEVNRWEREQASIKIEAVAH